MAKHVISYYFDGDFETGISFQHVFIASNVDVEGGLRSKKIVSESLRGKGGRHLYVNSERPELSREI